MEHNQNRHNQSKHRYGLPSAMPSDDLKQKSSANSALMQGVHAYDEASGPFSTYCNRSDVNSLHRTGNAALDRTLPKIVVSGVTAAQGHGSTSTVSDRMSAIPADVPPPSIGFGLYRPAFSEVLLNAANILESRANSGLINASCSEDFRSPMSELSPSSGADGMPVLQSQTLAERSPLAGYSSPAKSEETMLKPSSSMPCLTPENDSEPIELPSFISRFKEEPVESVKCRSVHLIKRDLSDMGDNLEAREELDFTDWVAMVCIYLISHVHSTQFLKFIDFQNVLFLHKLLIMHMCVYIILVLKFSNSNAY
jgi:hypothetical protein